MAFKETYQGFEITLDSWKRFAAEDERALPEEDRVAPMHSDTFEGIRTAIDRVIAKSRKEGLKDLRKPVVLVDDGKLGVAQVKLKSLHAARGYVLFEPASEQMEFYPNVPWIEAALQKRRQLMKEVQEITRKTQAFKVNGRYLSGDNMVDKWSDLLYKLDETTKKADANA